MPITPVFALIIRILLPVSNFRVNFRQGLRLEAQHTVIDFLLLFGSEAGHGVGEIYVRTL